MQVTAHGETVTLQEKKTRITLLVPNYQAGTLEKLQIIINGHRAQRIHKAIAEALFQLGRDERAYEIMKTEPFTRKYVLDLERFHQLATVNDIY